MKQYRHIFVSVLSFPRNVSSIGWRGVLYCEYLFLWNFWLCSTRRIILIRLLFVYDLFCSKTTWSWSMDFFSPLFHLLASIILMYRQSTHWPTLDRRVLLVYFLYLAWNEILFDDCVFSRILQRPVWPVWSKQFHRFKQISLFLHQNNISRWCKMLFSTIRLKSSRDLYIARPYCRCHDIVPFCTWI